MSKTSAEKVNEDYCFNLENPSGRVDGTNGAVRVDQKH